MPRLTISLPEATHERLRYRAARDNKSISEVIAEELRRAEEARRETVLSFLERARANSAEAPPMTEDEFTELAVRVTHEVREEMAAERASECS